MEIEHNLNFNDPVEVTMIYRVPDPTGGKPKEYGGKLSFGWEDVKSMEEYMHLDDWESHKGPKFWIQLHAEPNGKLILGSYQQMAAHWRAFRNTFPLFRVPKEDED